MQVGCRAEYDNEGGRGRPRRQRHECTPVPSESRACCSRGLGGMETPQPRRRHVNRLPDARHGLVRMQHMRV